MVVTFGQLVEELKKLHPDKDMPVVIEVGEMIKIYHPIQVTTSKAIRYSDSSGDRIARKGQSRSEEEGIKVIVIRPAK